MPEETNLAIEWALTQKIQFGKQEMLITLDNAHALVDMVREYFNINNIPYETFNYDDLLPYLSAGE